MKKGKESADAAAMGGDVAASGSSGSYDVFLSWGPDPYCFEFVDGVYRSLVEAGIRAFLEDKSGQFGDSISEECLRMVDETKIYIIFLKAYYTSGRLPELVAIVESKWKSGGGKTILPVFFQIEPHDLESSLYSVPLSERIGPEKLKLWADALKEVVSLHGWKVKVRSWKVGSYSFDQITGEIVEKVILKLKANKGIDKHVEGIDKHVEDMMDLLDLEVSDVRIVGIRGKDGVGKTTLAKVIYEKISSQFDRRSFLADIGATAKQLGGVRLLQSKLMSDILNREYEVDQVADGVDFLKEYYGI